VRKVAQERYFAPQLTSTRAVATLPDAFDDAFCLLAHEVTKGQRDEPSKGVRKVAQERYLRSHGDRPIFLLGLLVGRERRELETLHAHRDKTVRRRILDLTEYDPALVY
jgi:hypothetical protein